PHLGRRDVAGIDGRKTRGQQGDEGGLRPLQPEGHLVVGLDDHLLEVAVPGLARIDAQAVTVVALASQEVPGAFDVTRRERLAVVPFDARAQLEAQAGARLVPRPRGREIGHDRLQPALRHRLVVHHEIVEHPHHRALARDGRFLVDRQRGWAVEELQFQDAARFLRRGRAERQGQRERHAGQNGLLYARHLSLQGDRSATLSNAGLTQYAGFTEGNTRLRNAATGGWAA